LKWKASVVGLATDHMGYMGDHKTTNKIRRSDAQKKADFLNLDHDPLAL
jgi:hypothetical protein